MAGLKAGGVSVTDALQPLHMRGLLEGEGTRVLRGHHVGLRGDVGCRLVVVERVSRRCALSRQ